MRALRTHIVIDQTESLEPQAYCYLSDYINGTNYRTNLEQLSTIITLKDLLNSETNESNDRLIQRLQQKTNIHLQETITRLREVPFEIFYYINSDGGDQNLSDTLESINQRVISSDGRCLSFISQKACGSGGIAFYTSSNNYRYHSHNVTTGISLNMLEAYFYEKQDELEADFELFYQMQTIVNKKRNKMESIVVSACSPSMQMAATKEVRSQLEQAGNKQQKIILNQRQLHELGISTQNSNHFENISKHIATKELSLTLSIPKVYDFLEANSITYH